MSKHHEPISIWINSTHHGKGLELLEQDRYTGTKTVTTFPALTAVKAVGASLQVATPADADFLFRLYCNTRAVETAAWGWDESTVGNFLRQQYQARSAVYASRFPAAADYVIRVNDAPAGRVLVQPSAEELRLIDLALISDFRGLGIGSAVLADLKCEASALHVPLTLMVQFDNPAVALYQRHGFVITEGTDGVYLSMLWGGA